MSGDNNRSVRFNERVRADRPNDPNRQSWALRSANAELGFDHDPDQEGDFQDAIEGEDGEDDDEDEDNSLAARLLRDAAIEFAQQNTDAAHEDEDEEDDDDDEDFYAAEVEFDDMLDADDLEVDDDGDEDYIDDDEDEGIEEYIAGGTGGQLLVAEDDEDEEMDEDAAEEDDGDDDEEDGADGEGGTGQREMGLLELLAALSSARRGAGLSAMALRALRQYAASSGARVVRVGANGEPTDDDDDDEDYDISSYRRSSRDQYQRPKMSDRWEQVAGPTQAGQEVLHSGEFGKTSMRPVDAPKGNFAPTKNLYGIINRQKTSTRPMPRHELSNYVPNTAGVEVARYEDPCYCGQFSEDSTFFYSCTQDFMVHMYDTTTSQPELKMRSSTTRFTNFKRLGTQVTSLRPIKSIRGRQGTWTITDANLSPDNRFMIYSSITPYVHLVPTGFGEEDPLDDYSADEVDSVDPENPSHSEKQVRLDFGASPSRQGWYDSGSLWSIRFSGDSREIVAGAGSGDIAVYDIEARRQSLRVSGHERDVNAVAFADKQTGNILISGSDDSYVKVWDRRALRHGRAAGVLAGHTEGVTFVSPKGDGNYCVSNGKDQCAKLWDLRLMHAGSQYDRLSRLDYGIDGFDYRTGFTRPDDCSVMTFRGHAVLRTLIRCHFSPIATTGQKYIYSGSADGFIHIWSLDGRVVQVLDRSQVRPLVADPVEGAAAPSGPDYELDVSDEADPSLTHDGFEGRYASLLGAPRRMPTCVRDVSWHSAEPSLMSTAWNGANRTQGSIAKHEWKDFGKRGLSFEDALEKARLEAAR
ncbi:hypothetical protein OC846_005663 [Tilletia horrida]|uniref:WD40 repeat-like protein n=1 Tax=Tilletia horrida TaxID=155126 RepID=A0AAN6JQ08_9BASI|nr:hypothetical protein OC846_005663 [Tilletia horrida]